MWTCKEQRVVGDGLVPSRCPGDRGISGVGDHKGRPYDGLVGAERCGRNRRGRACPVPLPRVAGMSRAGDHKGRPYAGGRVLCDGTCSRMPTGSLWALVALTAVHAHINIVTRQCVSGLGELHVEFLEQFGFGGAVEDQIGRGLQT